MAGIIEEQHPDRAQLFMQWKQVGWPVMVDSLNLLNVPYVPITLEIDEGGVIRFVNPPFGKRSDIQEKFLSRVFQSAMVSTPAPPAPPDLEKLRRAATKGAATAWGTYADALVLWGGQQRLGEALAAYKRALELAPQEGRTHFRLGVAYRKRYDSSYRQPGDFQMAVGNGRQHWTPTPTNTSGDTESSSTDLGSISRIRSTTGWKRREGRSLRAVRRRCRCRWNLGEANLRRRRNASS